MDSDLDRSLRLLEDSISSKGRFLLSTPKNKDLRRKTMESPMTPQTLRKLDDKLGDSSFTIYDKSFSTLIDDNVSITGSIVRASEPWKATVNSLYLEFYETLQMCTNSHDVFDVITDLARCCTDALQVIKSLKSKSSIQYVNEDIWLEKERNTWRLLLVLYQDRLLASKDMEDVQQPYFGDSEKLCIANLFKADPLVRETQLVIDWLEYSAAERDIEALHFSDFSYGWENTFHQLQSAETIVFESSKKIVTEMHPDAPWVEELHLHDLDTEDEKRLCKKIFQEIRCGKLNKAQKVCISSGHAWRAALLEGWRLYHNPNTVPQVEDVEMYDADRDEMGLDSALQPTEGNETRDIWKVISQAYCEKEYLNIYEKASLASFCGHLKSLLRVGENWEDYLWAYLKVLIDIRVESEIRDNISKKYVPLPEEYWDQRLSLNEVFEYLESAPNTKVRKESQLEMHIVQKHLILDDIPRLMEIIGNWIENRTLSTQFLRFAVHLVLFLEQIGQIVKRDVPAKIIESYVLRLAEMDETRLVSFYVSKLGVQKQVEVYASYLERILDDNERREALAFAEDCGLDTHAIAKRVVENIRNRPHEIGALGNLQQKLTDTDLLKISAIDWLLISNSTKLDAIEQTNALIFTFLTMKKLDAAQLAFNKIPQNFLDDILSEGDAVPEINQILREYLSYRTYLDAEEAFNEWYKQFKSKPLPPGEVAENAHFTERVAHEHKEAQFKADTERWNMSTLQLAKTAKGKLYNVLLFPEGGWLSGAKDCEFLRSTCIPEIVMLLYSVLNDSDCGEECLQLADIISSEKYGLYKVFPKTKLKEFLHQLCNTSASLLNKEKDPWGNVTIN
ncbi:hypothetical protein PPYR_11156 [Photinus pyralis]|uniref:Nuclear pore complex protein n=2 Tax=Photinus pyralis TaxID=7054 RepID=A0A1Y1MF97_PHOPY|nr:nuclear pore complex protein Nup107 [Photinus pyralis]KAB0794317.1 hypothetical protein PPYR_11156 [Photinus pyralis]